MTNHGYIDWYSSTSYVFDREERTCVIHADMLDRLHEYSGTLPTAPSAGRIYKRNRWDRHKRPPEWWIVLVEDDPTDSRYQLHHAHKVLEVVP